MTRTVCYTIYKFDELPDEKARERAREWWRNLECNDPAWQSEHFASMNAILNHCEVMGLSEVIRLSEELAFTGYRADAIFADHAPSVMPLPSLIKKWYEDAWNKEFNDRMMSNEYIHDALRANEYEFYENGNKF
jgi:hypothetical protein